MNKHTHTHAIYAARLALLLAGSAAVASLPSSMAAADSHIQTAALNAPVAATAHVNFKIIIPQVLSLQMAGGNDRAVGIETVAVMSNSRNVTLNATRSQDSMSPPSSNDSIRTIAGRGTGSGPGHVASGGSVILSAAGRKVIAQDAPCVPAASRPGAVPTPVVCTVSMP